MAISSGRPGGGYSEEEVRLFEAPAEDLSVVDPESEEEPPLFWLFCSADDLPLLPAEAGLGFRESVT